MSQSEARAWWADVEHLRERLDGGYGRRPRQRRTPIAPRSCGSPTSPWRASRPPSQRRQPLRRRTVTITGRGAPAPAITPRHLVEVPQPGEDAVPARAPKAPRALGRVTHRPDRIAMWAVLLGFALVLAATASAHAATSLGDRTLHVPMRGHDVRTLQKELGKVGLLSAAPTAYYGPLTRSAVRRFQRSRCLEADGIAGPATIAALRRGAARCARDRWCRGAAQPRRHLVRPRPLRPAHGLWRPPDEPPDGCRPPHAPVWHARALRARGAQRRRPRRRPRAARRRRAVRPHLGRRPRARRARRRPRRGSRLALAPPAQGAPAPTARSLPGAILRGFAAIWHANTRCSVCHFTFRGNRDLYRRLANK